MNKTETLQNNQPEDVESGSKPEKITAIAEVRMLMYIIPVALILGAIAYVISNLQ